MRCETRQKVLSSRIMRTEASAAQGRRLRAARVYSGLRTRDIAEQLDVVVPTVERWERGDNPASAATVQMYALICDVPYWFVKRGFSAPQTGAGENAVKIPPLPPAPARSKSQGE